MLDIVLEEDTFDGHGRCADVTRDMAAKDPTLTRVKGWYHCWDWGKRDHWWLKDANGKIIDPTADQFPSKGCGEYEEHDPAVHKTPIGKCMNCGEETFEHTEYCDEACLAALERYYGKSLVR